MKTDAYTLRWLPEDYAVIRTEAGRRPEPAGVTGFHAVLQDQGETTVIAPAAAVAGMPASGRSGPWRVLRLDGPLPHDAVGILARLADVLATARVPIFALSTYATDCFLVPSGRMADAHRALVDAGYTFHEAR